MANCLLCSKDITAGYVLCGECAADVKFSTEPEMLEHFIEWLGKEMANDFAVKPCSMCGREHCSDISQCRIGVTAWLRAKAEKYCHEGIDKKSCTTTDMPRKENKMDAIVASGLPGFYLDARGVYGIVICNYYVSCSINDESGLYDVKAEALGEQGIFSDCQMRKRFDDAKGAVEGLARMVKSCVYSFREDLMQECYDTYLSS